MKSMIGIILGVIILIADIIWISISIPTTPSYSQSYSAPYGTYSQTSPTTSYNKVPFSSYSQPPVMTTTSYSDQYPPTRTIRTSQYSGYSQSWAPIILGIIILIADIIWLALEVSGLIPSCKEDEVQACKKEEVQIQTCKK